VALVHLARHGDGRPVASHIIAAAEGIPDRFLMMCLKPLASAGVLRSVKGPSGGYRLARPPQAITLLEVVEALEGPVRGYATPMDVEGAEGVNRKLQAVCDKVAGVVRQGLRGVTLKDLFSRGK
jgi:Rrf2 family transcriptional regulator, cysteine metabolism repressor